MAVPNIFGSATSAIPLSQLDTNFATPVTIGNTAVQLGNTVTSFGNVTLTNVTISSGNVTVSAGSNTAPSITTVGDTNTGIFFPAADTIAFTEGGAEAMRLDSAGNMGLGVTPSAWRSTYKAAQVGNAAAVAGRTDNNNNYFSSNWYVNSSNQDIYQNTGFATIYSQGTGTHIWYTAASGTAGNPISFTQAMTLDASGNLGIGATTISSMVHLRRDTSSSTSTAYPNIRLDNPNAAGYTGLYFFADGTQKAGLEVSNAAGALQFFTGTTERARITSGGNLFINTINELLADRKLQVVRDAGNPVIFKVENGVGNEVLLLWNNATSGNNLFQEFATEGSITVRGSIDYNRGAGQVRYNATSDATLKNIIGDADGQKSLEILNSTRIREYAWKDDPTQKPQIGVIAQELYETFKGAVSVGGEVEETDDDGNVITKHRHWGVDKTAFTFHLVAGWQAHEKIIKQQADMIAALEVRLTALENK